MLASVKPARITILSNTKAQLTDANDGFVGELDQALCMDVEGSRFDPRTRQKRACTECDATTRETCRVCNGKGKVPLWDGKKHFFSVKTGKFPLGLMHHVERLLKEGQWRYEVVDSRTDLAPPPKLSRIKPDMLKGVRFEGKYSYQLDVIKTVVEKKRGILWLATNAGKTEIAAAVLKVLRELPAIYLVGKRGLLVDAQRRIAERLDTIEQNIGVIGNGRFDPQHITVATVQSLASHLKKKQGRYLKKTGPLMAEFLASRKVMFVDEGHHERSTSWFTVTSKIPAEYRILQSGTPFGSGNGLMVEAACGPVIARVSNDTLVQLGVSAKPKVRIIEMRDKALHQQLLQYTLPSDWDTVSKLGIVTNTERNMRIARRAKLRVAQKKPCLIIIRELWHGRMISTMLTSLGVKHEFVHGQMPLARIDDAVARFQAHKTPVLIASWIFDEGKDLPAMRALIVADGGKSPRAVLQKIGRGLRAKKGAPNEVDVDDFGDTCHKWLADHSLQRISIYESEGFDVAEIPAE